MKERLLLLIQHTGLSINQFEATLGAGNSSFRKIVDHDSGLSTKNIEKIFTTFPEYNLDWLLTGRGSMLLTIDSKGDDFSLPLAKPVRESVVTVDTSENSVVPILDVKAAAGPPTMLDEPDYYKELPTFTFPNYFFRGGALVSIPVRGDSMTPTIKQGDYVIGKELERLAELKSGEVYIIIHQIDQRVAFTVKRCFYFAGDEAITLQSDNADYPIDQLPVEAVLKIYHVEASLSSQLHKTESSVKGHLERIERRIDRIEKRINE